METVGHLRHLFAYNDWANRRIVVALKDSASTRSLEILAHLLITEKEYYERLYGKNSTGFDFWPKLSIEECGVLARGNCGGVREIIAAVRRRRTRDPSEIPF
jgi:uncharacterized damage-inducible protein DinB